MEHVLKCQISLTILSLIIFLALQSRCISGFSPHGCSFFRGVSNCNFLQWSPPLVDSNFGPERLYDLRIVHLNGTISAGAFSELHGPLTHLAMYCYNGATTLSREIFTPNLSSLTRLQIFDCFLHDGLSSQLLENLRSLEYFMIVKGRIEGSVAHDTLAGLTNLCYVDLSAAIETASLPVGFFSDLKNLTNIKLSHAKLNFIQHNLFNGLISLEKIYLDFNNLQILPPGLFDELRSLTYVYLPYNPWNCSCGLKWLLDWSHITRGPNVCESPTEFNGVQLKYALTSLDCTPSTSTILPVRVSSAIEIKEIQISSIADSAVYKATTLKLSTSFEKSTIQTRSSPARAKLTASVFLHQITSRFTPKPYFTTIPKQITSSGTTKPNNTKIERQITNRVTNIPIFSTILHPITSRVTTKEFSMVSQQITSQVPTKQASTTIPQKITSQVTTKSALAMPQQQITSENTTKRKYSTILQHFISRATTKPTSIKILHYIASPITTKQISTTMSQQTTSRVTIKQTSTTVLQQIVKLMTEKPSPKIYVSASKNITTLPATSTNQTRSSPLKTNSISTTILQKNTSPVTAKVHLTIISKQVTSPVITNPASKIILQQITSPVTTNQTSTTIPPQTTSPATRKPLISSILQHMTSAAGFKPTVTKILKQLTSVVTTKPTFAMFLQQLVSQGTGKPTFTRIQQHITTTDTISTPLSPVTSAFLEPNTSISTSNLLTTTASEGSTFNMRNIKTDETTRIVTEGSAGISSNKAIIAGGLGAGFAALAVGVGFSKWMLSQNACSRVSPFASGGRRQVHKHGTRMHDAYEIARPRFRHRDLPSSKNYPVACNRVHEKSS